MVAHQDHLLSFLEPIVHWLAPLVALVVLPTMLALNQQVILVINVAHQPLWSQFRRHHPVQNIIKNLHKQFLVKVNFLATPTIRCTASDYCKTRLKSTKAFCNLKTFLCSCDTTEIFANNSCGTKETKT